MSEEEPEPDAVERAALDNDRKPTARWVRRGVFILVAVVVVLIAYRAGSSFMPRWWAQRVGAQADGRFTAGVLWGLFYGFTFTFIPVLLLFQVRRRFLNWKAKVVVALLAFVLAAPNWLTLAVVVANSNAAHAGERIFDVEAPGFRRASAIGVGVGGVIAIAMSGTSIAMSRKRRQVKDLKEQVKANKREKDETARERDQAERRREGEEREQ